MAKDKIEGARLVEGVWHYYKRIPKRLREAFGLQEFRRGTMGIKDPGEARILARKMLTELDDLTAKLDSVSARMNHFADLTEPQQAQLNKEVAANLRALPTDQRQLIEKSGGVWDAGRAMKKHEFTSAFMQAGLGAKFEVRDEIGKKYDPEKRDDAVAQDQGLIDRHTTKAKPLRDALAAAGVVEGSNTFGLREVLVKFCKAKGYVDTKSLRNVNRQQYEYTVRRFIEHAGNLSLAELSRKHLADFGQDYLKLPVSSRKDIRPLAFWDAAKVAEVEGLSLTSPRSRDTKLTHLKTLMAYAVSEGLYEGSDPWARYASTSVRQKVSARREKKVRSFSRDEIRKIITTQMSDHHPDTVDYWAPLLGGHQGLRIEEVCQLRAVDYSLEEGVPCITVTDAGEHQTVKTEHSLRTIPVHPQVMELGFGEFVARRRAAGAKALFMKQAQHGDKLTELTPDPFGRLAGAYMKRFSRAAKKLGLSGHRMGFHSLRHGWTDLARNARVDAECRLALAGRDADIDSPLLDATELRYGHGFSVERLLEELSKIQILD